jgi:hypothetical protein
MHFIYGFLKKRSDHFLFKLWSSMEEQGRSSMEEQGREIRTRVSTSLKVQCVKLNLDEAEKVFEEEMILREINKCIADGKESEIFLAWKEKTLKWIDLVRTSSENLSNVEKHKIAYVLKKLDAFKDTQLYKVRNVIMSSVKAYFDKDSPPLSSSSLTSSDTSAGDPSSSIPTNTTPIFPVENHSNEEGIITISLSSSLLSSDVVTTSYYSFRYIRRSRSQRRGGRSRSHIRC